MKWTIRDTIAWDNFDWFVVALYIPYPFWPWVFVGCAVRQHCAIEKTFTIKPLQTWWWFRKWISQNKTFLGSHSWAAETFHRSTGVSNIQVLNHICFTTIFFEGVWRAWLHNCATKRCVRTSATHMMMHELFCAFSSRVNIGLFRCEIVEDQLCPDIMFQ